MLPGNVDPDPDWIRLDPDPEYGSRSNRTIGDYLTLTIKNNKTIFCHVCIFFFIFLA